MLKSWTNLSGGDALAGRRVGAYLLEHPELRVGHVVDGVVAAVLQHDEVEGAHPDRPGGPDDHGPCRSISHNLVEFDAVMAAQSSHQSCWWIRNRVYIRDSTTQAMSAMYVAVTPMMAPCGMGSALLAPDDGGSFVAMAALGSG